MVRRRGRPARRRRVAVRDQEVTAILDALRRLVRAARTAALRAQRRVRITGAQLFVLEQLARSPAPSLNQLASRTYSHKSSVSVVVSRLVSRGLVRRRRSLADRRGIELELTPAGRAALRAAPQTAQTRFVRALRRLQPEEREALVVGLDRFTELLRLGEVAPKLLFEPEAEEPL